ncbi:MAG: molybdate ABC transporter substrate-binding protein [Phycisphaerae bacterium]|nr:molybdate ABC transporter substrate-binding protein [Phycisphaerae bacterium]
MNKRFGFLVLVVALVAASFFAWWRWDSSEEELLLLCGAGLRPAVHEIAEQFTARTGVKVRVDYNASNLLLGRIQVGREGDLFLPGEEHYVQLAARDGLIHESHPAAVFVPVILVGRGNPKRIRALSDLARDNIRLGLADARTAAVGRVARQILEKNAVSPDAIRKNLIYESVTVPELAASVDLGHIDAAIVWAPVAMRFSNTEIVAIPPEQNILATVPISVLSFSKQKASARALVEYVLSDAGQAVFRKYGFDTPGNRKDSVDEER